MTEQFILSPRYRLDDESPWLEGIDPARYYWIFVNGSREENVSIPGLNALSISEWKECILRFRDLEPQEKMQLERIVGGCTVYCLSSNCYAIEGEVKGAEVWHLFDRETLESLLMSAHPDWQAAPQHIELGKRHLARAFEQPAFAKASRSNRAN